MDEARVGAGTFDYSRNLKLGRGDAFKTAGFDDGELHAKYEGRVIAYNHRSVTRSPDENALWFLDQVSQAAPQSRLTFDVLCHSRGGIVARALAERGRMLRPECTSEFRKVYFVATPNRGSALGDPAHIVDMIDVFTNLLTNFPDGLVMYSIEVLLAMIKLLA